MGEDSLLQGLAIVNSFDRNSLIYSVGGVVVHGRAVNRSLPVNHSHRCARGTPPVPMVSSLRDWKRFPAAEFS